MADITPLFESTSLSPPKLGAKGGTTTVPPSASNADALGMALLTGILTDLAVLKEAFVAQAGFNRAFNEVVQNLIARQATQHEMTANSTATAVSTADQLLKLGEHVNRLGDIIVALDAWLKAIDGATSVPVEAATGQPAHY